MIDPLAPPHFKNPHGSPKRFKELRHRFRQSTTAQNLIDFSEKHGVSLSDSTDYLAARGWAGAYDRENRIVGYSCKTSAINLFHEFRHAQQFYALDSFAPEYAGDCHSQDLRKVLMNISLLETDAFYQQERVRHEMLGTETKILPPPLFYYQFLRHTIHLWFSAATLHHLTDTALMKDYHSGPWGLVLEMGEHAYNSAYLRVVAPLALTPAVSCEQRDAEVSYLRDISNLVCAAPNGQNYLLSGKSSQEQEKILRMIWDASLGQETAPIFGLLAHKEQLRHRLNHAVLTLSALGNSFSIR